MRRWGYVFLLAGFALFLQVAVAQTQPPSAPQVVKFNPKTMSTPVLLHSVLAYNVESRPAKYQGVSLISLVVDAEGNPQDVRVAHPIGMGLDEKALEAVRQYKFKPAVMKDGDIPVPVRITVEVKFLLY